MDRQDYLEYLENQDKADSVLMDIFKLHPHIFILDLTQQIGSKDVRELIANVMEDGDEDCDFLKFTRKAQRQHRIELQEKNSSYEADRGV